jgi:hypothetical protein
MALATAKLFVEEGPIASLSCSPPLEAADRNVFAVQALKLWSPSPAPRLKLFRSGDALRVAALKQCHAEVMPPDSLVGFAVRAGYCLRSNFRIGDNRTSTENAFLISCLQNGGRLYIPDCRVSVQNVQRTVNGWQWFISCNRGAASDLQE